MDSLSFTKDVLGSLVEVEGDVLRFNFFNVADIGNQLPWVLFNLKQFSFVIASLSQVLIDVGKHLFEGSS